MDFSIWTILIALFVNAFFAYLAYNHGSVTFDGAAAGTVVGSGIMAGGGFWFWMILLFFFSSSTLFSFMGRDIKASLEKLHEKSHVRDAFQVLANGLLGFLTAVLYGVTGQEIFAVAFAAALCAAASDTWAGEVGVSSRKPPVSIITFKPVERGLSGGVSLRGTLFAFLGSMGVGLLFFFNRIITFGQVNRTVVLMVGIAVVSGFLSSLADSLLGAAAQVHYRDDHTGIITEKRVIAGKNLTKIRGVSWINNDMVNFLSILFSVLLASSLYLLFL